MMSFELGCRERAPIHRSLLVGFGLMLMISGTYAESAEPFLPTFIARIAGANLQPGDERDLARYSVLFLNKFHYDDIGGDSWGAIKRINPNVEIYLYTNSALVNSKTDNHAAVYLNQLGRYNVSRGHSMGSLNGNHASYFLKGVNGNRLYESNVGHTNLKWLDFGNSNFRRYSVEATVADHSGVIWQADGVYSDNVAALTGSINASPNKYPTNTAWAAAMNGFVNHVAGGLRAQGLKYAANRGHASLADGYDAWVALDGLSTPPDIVLEEGAFAVTYGSGDVQFRPESAWKRQVDLLREIKRSKVAYQSHTGIAPGQSGIDNYGKPFKFHDALWFAMGSFVLGKNEQGGNYFTFRGTAPGDTALYREEYDRIDLGAAVGPYNVKSYGGVNIYSREFSGGYVLVNPTPTNVQSVALPGPLHLLTFGRLYDSPASLPTVSSIAIPAHRAVFLYKPGGTGGSGGGTGGSGGGGGSGGEDVRVYEDGEDGGTQGWQVYDATPGGATIRNVFDSQAGSRVIELSGSGTQNGYRLKRADGSSWNDTEHDVLEIDLRFSESFTIFVKVDTAFGTRFLTYRPGTSAASKIGASLNLPLGAGLKTGNWVSVRRNLQTDIKSLESGNALISVANIAIRGSGKVDNIRLVGTGSGGGSGGTNTRIYEDGEDGGTQGWQVYDATPAGATIRNMFDSQAGSRVIELSGSGTQNGYRLNQADGSAWNDTERDVLEIDLRYSESFTIFVKVDTAFGIRFLTYRPGTSGASKSGASLNLPLGAGLKTGKWVSVRRNLQTDIKSLESGNALIAVKNVAIRGSGRVDNIALLTSP